MGMGMGASSAGSGGASSVGGYRPYGMFFSYFFSVIHFNARFSASTLQKHIQLSALHSDD